MLSLHDACPISLSIHQALFNQLHALPIIAPMQDTQIFRISEQIDAGRLGVHFHLRFRKRGKISGPAFGGLELYLACSVKLWSIGMQGAFPPPEVEYTGRVLLLFHRLAPVPG